MVYISLVFKIIKCSFFISRYFIDACMRVCRLTAILNLYNILYTIYSIINIINVKSTIVITCESNQ